MNPSETQMKHGEHVGGDGAKPASPDHPRRAPPLRVSAGMSEFDGRRGGVRHGWGPAYESLPQGLERAPPRLIPGVGGDMVKMKPNLRDKQLLGAII